MPGAWEGEAIWPTVGAGPPGRPHWLPGAETCGLPGLPYPQAGSMNTACPPPAHPVPGRCLEQMAQDGLQLQDLFTSLPLCKEEQAILLRAVCKARPKFRPLPPGLQTQANTSPLLREIYEVSGPWPCGAQAGGTLPPSPGQRRAGRQGGSHLPLW